MDINTVMRLFRKKKSQHNEIISTVLLSVVFGLGAGVVGMLLVMAYAMPAVDPVLSSGPVTITTRTKNISPIPVLTSTSVASAARSSVQFFHESSVASRKYFNSYLSVDAIGSGMVLTSDGWLLTNDMVFDAKIRASLKNIVAIVGMEAYAVEHAIHDPFTGVVFLKIEGVNLPVTSFGVTDELVAGQSVFVLDSEGMPRRIEVIAIDDVPIVLVQDLIHSSERQQKVLRLSGAADGVLPGSMVVDVQGDVLGIFAGNDSRGSYAVQIASFSRNIGDILRENIVDRPYLGISYIDISKLVGVHPFGESAHGALIVADASGRPGVQRESPAMAAGLREGDLIVAVNGENITVNKALSDVLADYEPGRVITVTVRHAMGSGAASAVEIPVEVTLGNTP